MPGSPHNADGEQLVAGKDRCRSVWLGQQPPAGFYPSREIGTASFHQGDENASLVDPFRIAYLFPTPIFADKGQGLDGRLFYGEGHLRTEADLDKMSLPDPENPEIYEAARRFVAGKEDFAAVALLRMGISATMLSMGIEHFCISLLENPLLVTAVLRRYADWAAKVAEKLCQIGFDVIYFTDDIAFKSGPFFSPAAFREFILPELRRVAEKLSLPWVYHSDGNLWPIMDDLLDLGMSGLNPIEPEAMDIAEVKRRYGSRACLIGNISVNTLSMGSVEDVRREVYERIKQVGPGGGYIVASGNSLAAYCKVENILAMADAVQEYGQYPLQ